MGDTILIMLYEIPLNLHIKAMQHRFWKTQKTMKSFESKIQLKPANHSKKKIIHRGVFRF